MAYAHIRTASKAGTGTTSAVDTTGADLIVAFVASYNDTPTPTDSKGNTYTALTLRSGGSDANVKGRMFFCAAPTVGTGHTFTTSSSAVSSAYLAFSGSAASPLDQQSTAAATQPGSVTPTENDELLVCCYGDASSANPTAINSSFTLEVTIAGQSSIQPLGAAYLIQTSSAAVNPTWTVSNIYSAVSCIATFKAAGGGGVSVRPRLMSGRLVNKGLLLGGLAS